MHLDIFGDNIIMKLLRLKLCVHLNLEPALFVLRPAHLSAHFCQTCVILTKEDLNEVGLITTMM